MIVYVTDSLPTTLTIFSNGNVVFIFPNTEESISSSVSYTVSMSHPLVAVSVPIILNVPKNIYFFQCNSNTTFTIGKYKLCVYNVKNNTPFVYL